MAARKVVIMGAAGRDFHNFNVFFRDNPAYQVVAFTAFQIPGIAGRTYPPGLAGKLYPKGIPIRDESELEALVRSNGVEEVVFAYSDISHEAVMQRASLVMAAGADFRLMGAGHMLKSGKPVISVCAVRTGCGKSQVSRRVAELLRAKGRKAVVVRHPMPYGDLLEQRCQRFATLDDLDKQKCTIEEREEYEPHIRLGHLVYAGVDYGDILKAAEREGDVILWDGGNNDFPFYKPDLHVVIADPLRPGDEVRYHPGESNVRLADAVIINKVGSADPKNVGRVQSNVRAANPTAEIILADSTITVEDDDLQGRRALIIEDGPTVTHGGMGFGAGHVAARRHGAVIVDPRPYAVGSLRDTFKSYPHLAEVLPAMGYSGEQIRDLEASIEKTPCDVVLVGTPFDLGRVLKTRKKMVRVSYELDAPGTEALEKLVDDVLKRKALEAPVPKPVRAGR